MVKILRSTIIIIIVLSLLLVVNAKYYISDSSVILPTSTINGSLKVKGPSPYYDITGYGAIPNDNADDSQAIQSAINAVPSTGGTVFIPAGTYDIHSSIVPKSNLTIIGEGIGITILKGHAALKDTSVIQNISIVNNAIKHLRLADFEIDGSAMNTTGYSALRKGVYLQYVNDSIFENLLIHHTPATGLGIDFLTNTVIDKTIVHHCGTAGQMGSNGIGVGTSGTVNRDVEPVIISNSIAYLNANKGIMVEEQHDDADRAIIDNCIAWGNYDGFSIAGTSHVILSDSHSYNNTRHGLLILNTSWTFTEGSSEWVTVTGNNFFNNGQNGIHAEGKNNRYITIDDNVVYQNWNDGIKFEGSFIFIRDNLIKYNGWRGIIGFGYVDSSHIMIDGNYIYDNGMENFSFPLFSDGIQLKSMSAGVVLSEIMVTNNFMGDIRSSGKTQRYGLNLAGSGSYEDVFVTNNDFTNNWKPGILNETPILDKELITFNNINTTHPNEVVGHLKVGLGGSQKNITLTSPDLSTWCCGVGNAGAFSCRAGEC